MTDKVILDQHYRPDIDGLRALAILLVLAYHAFPAVLPGGFVGVDVFFVISGYLITRNIADGLYSSQFTFADFYSKRIRRIFPSLIVVLIFCLIFGWVVLRADEYKQLGKHIFGGTVFSSNLLLWMESSYFDEVTDKKPLLHLWSLGVEWQFYLLMPILLYICLKKISVLFFR